MPKREEERKEEPSKMTVEEAGKKGGEVTKETYGREFYREIGKKGGVAPRGAAARGIVPEKGEVIVIRAGKDLDITFSSDEEADDWRDRFAPMLEKEGYHFIREKPETARAEAARAEAGE